MKKRLKQWVKILFIIGISLLLTIIIINSYVVLTTKQYIKTIDEVKNLNADCVMVLGAGVWSNGTPSLMLEDRLLRGLELYEQDSGDKLLMSGDHGQVNYDEVNIMKNYALEEGVVSSDVFMDHAGFSTYESMYRARDVFDVDSMVIVTQGYHLYRALYNANGLGIEVYGVASDQHRFKGQTMRDLREILARVKDFFYVLFKPEPTYLGEVISIEGDGDLTND